MFGLIDRMAKASHKHASKSRKREQVAFNALPALTSGMLKMGDILIVKDFSDWGHDSDSDYIRGGQALFSRMGSGGHATSEHALIVESDGLPHVFEAIGSGVIRREFVSSRQHVVYRYTGKVKKVVRAEAVRVARYLCGGFALDTDAINSPIPVEYASTEKMAASVFRAKFRGVSAIRRIKRIHDLYSNNKDVGTANLKMICSEFVATCYEVAACSLGMQGGALGVDPRGLSAKALESVLNRNDYFTLKGRYTGNVSHTMHQQLKDAYFFGPMLHVANRELARGNSLAGGNHTKTHGTSRIWAARLSHPFRLQHAANPGLGITSFQEGGRTYLIMPAAAEVKRGLAEFHHNGITHIGISAPTPAGG